MIMSPFSSLEAENGLMITRAGGGGAGVGRSAGDPPQWRPWSRLTRVASILSSFAVRANVVVLIGTANR
ncbi:MAG: hypothetical protein JWN54_3827 [Mycobacterium sp.]|nr:hypothetical protein [Mycobacterium sp.]